MNHSEHRVRSWIFSFYNEAMSSSGYFLTYSNATRYLKESIAALKIWMWKLVRFMKFTFICHFTLQRHFCLYFKNHNKKINKLKMNVKFMNSLIILRIDNIKNGRKKNRAHDPYRKGIKSQILLLFPRPTIDHFEISNVPLCRR